MKSLKLLISVITLGLVAVASSASAADGGRKGRGQMSPDQQVAALEESVGSLSAEQKTKITAVYAKAAEDLRATPKEERKEKAAGIMQATRKEVRALLTAEQQAKFDAMGAGGKRKKN